MGDEVVLTWLKDEGLKNLNCVKFFYGFQNILARHKSSYEQNFGFIPEFKAGLHLGKITVAEVGDIKREIAYHGDTINIAARIQSLCNKYDQNFLISESIMKNINVDTDLKINFLEDTVLKGRTNTIKLYSIEKRGV